MAERQLENYIGMTVEHLDKRGKELSLAIREGYLNPERKEQVQHELSLLSFELYQRHLEGTLEVVDIKAV